MLEENVKKDILDLENMSKIVLFNFTKEVYIIHMDYFNFLKENILGELEKFHRENPLKPGMPKEEIRSRFLKKC